MEGYRGQTEGYRDEPSGCEGESWGSEGDLSPESETLGLSVERNCESHLKQILEAFQADSQAKCSILASMTAPVVMCLLNEAQWRAITVFYL